MAEFTFRCTLTLTAKNYESASKKFLNFVSKRTDQGYQQCLEEIILERKSEETFSFQSLDEIPEEKKELVRLIEKIKPHNGKTSLKDFTVAQLQAHLIKLGGTPPPEIETDIEQEEEILPVKKKWKRKGAR